MPETTDVLIVGAGIVGAACARACTHAGLSVCVLEAAVVGGGATGAGMGHLVVMDDSPAQCTLTRFGRQAWDTLVQEQPGRHEYARCGTIWIAADAEEFQAVGAKQALLAAHGVSSEILDAPALYQCEPQVRAGLAGGLLVPGDGVVYPPRSAALLLDEALRHGARLMHDRARQLVPGGVVLAGGRTLHAAAVVLANGMAALDLLPDLPLRAKKGHLAITDRYPARVRHQLVELGYASSAHAATGDSVACNVQPRPTGQILIGSSRQFDDLSSTVDHAILGRMLRRALWYLPVLETVSCIRIWTGVRAATPDGLPLIGPHPARPGLWLATGHEGLGITTALATAEILIAQLLRRAAAIAVEPFLPARLVAAGTDG